MTRSHDLTCPCADCWIERRVAIYKARSTPDDRFERTVEPHSRERFASGHCRCQICRDEHNRYRRDMRKRT